MANTLVGFLYEVSVKIWHLNRKKKDENESDMQQKLKTHSKHMQQQIQNPWVCITIIGGGRARDLPNSLDFHLILNSSPLLCPSLEPGAPEGNEPGKQSPRHKGWSREAGFPQLLPSHWSPDGPCRGDF